MNDTFRKQFPILKQSMHGKPLAYLDNAATTQRPQVVIDALKDFDETTNANPHRGIYELAENATAQFEGVRATVQQFLKARKKEEIIFTKNATESINLVAQSWAKQNIGKGDAILVTEMEHHSNLVPWQQLATQVGAELRFAPMTDDGRLDSKEFQKLLDDSVKLVALTAYSNVLGTILPVKELIKKAHAVGALVLVDAAQAAAHIPLDVQSLNCDFLALSAHKMYGPHGVGVLFVKEDHYAAMEPYQFGGSMILDVQKDESHWEAPPLKFEAGTPNVTAVVGFGAAIDFLTAIGWESVQQHEQELTQHLLSTMLAVDGVTVYGPHDTKDRGGVVSFTVKGVHPHDLATIFDQEGIAIRSGHHCAQVLMERCAVPAMARASVALYTTKEDIDRIPKAIERAKAILT